MKMVLILIISFMLLFSSLTAQDMKDDIINFTYEKKSPHKAAILSALLPGAGQYYISPGNITAYIFPLIEVGLLYGMFYYNSEGRDQEKAYEFYATGEIIGYENNDPVNGDPIFRYDRDKFCFARDDLILSAQNHFYDNHFNLDDTNTQHFYEDIGKYNKYIFGWVDWFDIYSTDASGNWIGPDWRFVDDGQGNKWVGNNPTNPGSDYYLGNEESYDAALGRYSAMRADYIEMRQEAENMYDKSHYFRFGLVFNHITAALDAVRVTRKHNARYYTSRELQINFGPAYINNEICPTLVITRRF